LQPQSHGTITLASADPAVAPLIDPGYLSEDDDIARLIAGQRLARSLLQTSALAPHVGDSMRPERWLEEDAALEAAMSDYGETLYRPTGTCGMGGDDAAVVDPELRVRGVDGLRVADASVMPQIIRGHTHAPTVMIGEKAADLIIAARGVSGSAPA